MRQGETHFFCIRTAFGSVENPCLTCITFIFSIYYLNELFRPWNIHKVWEKCDIKNIPEPGCSCLFEVQKIGKKENLLLLFTKSVKRTKKKNSKQKLSPGRPTQFKPQTQLNHCLFRSWSFMIQDSGIWFFCSAFRLRQWLRVMPSSIALTCYI